MLQRNTTDHPLDVGATGPRVQPGDTLDWPGPIIGFEPVEPVEPEPKKRKTAAPAGEETAR